MATPDTRLRSLHPKFIKNNLDREFYRRCLRDSFNDLDGAVQNRLNFIYDQTMKSIKEVENEFKRNANPYCE